jgi:hypothetical protein
MEDPSGSTQLASAMTTGSPMTWTGTPTLASYDGFSASDPLPDITSASLSGSVGKYDDPTATQVRFLVYIPKAGLADGKVVCAFDQVDYSAGSAQFWELYYSTTDASNSLVLRTCGSDGTVLGAILPHTIDVRGRLLYVSVELQESGTGITRQIQLKDVATTHVYAVSDTETLTQLTRVTKVGFGIAARAVSGPASTANLPGVAVGHATVENAITAIDALGVRLNTVGETAGRRVQRLCGEAGIPFEWVGDLDDTVPMGAQPKANTLSLVQEACLADGGLLYETKDVLGLGYRTRASLYNQTPALVLSYTGYNLADIPVPVEDDRQIQNNLTVTVGGVSASYAGTDGNLGTNTIGNYGETTGLTLNLATSDTPTLQDHAAWRVHLGTVDEARYPTITVNLAHPSITPDMRRAILALRMGDRAQITGMPAWVAPGNPDLLILGTSETLSNFEHKLTFTCAPASPYSYIGVLDDGISRLDTDGSQLLAAAGTTDTSIVVGPTDDPSMLWTTASSDLPLDVSVGGEVMTVTGINGYVVDTFTRTAANGWGNADSGQAWTTASGSASDYAVGSGAGSHTMTSVDVSRRCSINALIGGLGPVREYRVEHPRDGGIPVGRPDGPRRRREHPVPGPGRVHDHSDRGPDAAETPAGRGDTTGHLHHVVDPRGGHVLPAAFRGRRYEFAGAGVAGVGSRADGMAGHSDGYRPVAALRVGGSVDPQRVEYRREPGDLLRRSCVAHSPNIHGDPLGEWGREGAYGGRIGFAGQSDDSPSVRRRCA